MTRPRLARLLLLAGGLVVIAALAWRFLRPDAIPVQVVAVTRGPLVVSIDETGTTSVRAHADISAPIGGRWVPAALRRGDAVAVGTLLGMLHPAPLDANAREQAAARVGVTVAGVREVEAQLVAARSALEEARRSASRVAALGAVGAVAEQDAERARDVAVERTAAVSALVERLRAARHERTLARAALEAAQGTGRGLPMRSPLSGAVLRIAEEHERVVAPGTPLLEIGDPRGIEVRVPLLTADARRVQPGAPVRLTFGEGLADGMPETTVSDTVRGIVDRVEPAAYRRLSALGVEEQRVDVIVSVPAQSARLGDQYRADARITLWEARDMVRVPLSALVRDGDRWRAWRVREGRADPVDVRLGQRSAVMAQVLDGLQAGDTVVAFPPEALARGARVRPLR